MRNTRLLSLAAMVLIGGLAAAASADMVNLDLIVDPDGPGTWALTAALAGDAGGDPTSAGISDFMVDVYGTGGAEVTSSKNGAPASAFFHSGLFVVKSAGFAEIRTDGTNGMGIIGAQPSVYGTENDPIMDLFGILQGVGIDRPPDYYMAAGWNFPAVLATGEYTGSTGELNATGVVDGWLLLGDVGGGNGHGWEGPGHTVKPSAINGDTKSVGGGPVNQDPNADADGPYVEADWQEEPADTEVNFIILDGTGSSDPDGDTLTYTWDLTVNPGNPLVVTGATPKVLAATLVAHDYDFYVDYPITLTVDDGKGGSDTDETTLMVPEPGTIALLGFGVVGVLLRRRRS